MVQYTLDIRMLRPDVSEYLASSGQMNDWLPEQGDMYVRDFNDDDEANAWNRRLLTQLHSVFTDEPFYLFYLTPTP